jgi:type II secretion system protein J
MLKKNKFAITLIELIVAVTIFSVVAVAVYSTFNSGMSSYKKTEVFARLYQVSRSVLETIAQDLRNSFPYNETDAKFSGSNNEVSFFSLTDFITEENPHSEIAQITYRFQDGILRKLSLVGAAVFQDETLKAPQEDFSLEVKELKFQYAQPTDEPPGYVWRDNWGTEEKAKIPLGVKIDLTLEDKDTAKTVTQTKLVFISLGDLGQTE